MTPNPSHLEKIIEFVNASPYISLLDMRILSLENGRCIAEMDVRRKHTNFLGRMHGGAYESLMDTATYWAVYAGLPEDVGFTTLDLDANLTRSVPEGTRARCEANVIKYGRSVCICEARMYDEEWRLAGTCVSKLFVSPDLPSVLSAVEDAVGGELPPKFVEE